MSQALLAIDVGGSTSRVFLVDREGNCLGRGRGTGGNPASNNPEQAAGAIIAAAEQAVAAAGGAFDIELALIALAGPPVHVARAKLETAFRALGLSGPIEFSSDLLAMFASVTPTLDGYCVVAGTGSGAVRIRDGRIERAVDAAGWLLGDLGSGYWLGHEAAKAAAAELDGRGEATALTDAVLGQLGIERTPDMARNSRPAPLSALMDAVYALRPIELARFAPLVFANRGDAVASRLIATAEQYLATDFATAFLDDLPGPIALGGGVIAQFTGLSAAIGAVVRAAGGVPDIHLVTDGAVGASVLALRAARIAVDDKRFAAIKASVAGAADAPHRGGSASV